MIQRTIKQPSESDVAKTFKNDTQREITSAQIISKGRFGEHDSGQGINKKEAMFQATAYLMRNSLVALVVASRILPCAELATLLVDVRCSWRPSAKLDEGTKKGLLVTTPILGWFQVHDTLATLTCTSDIEKILVLNPEAGFAVHGQELLDWNYAYADAICWEISSLMCPRIIGLPLPLLNRSYLYRFRSVCMRGMKRGQFSGVRTKTHNHGNGASDKTAVAFQRFLDSPGCRVHNSEPAETTKSFLQVGKYLRKWEMWTVSLYTPFRLSRVLVHFSFLVYRLLLLQCVARIALLGRFVYLCQNGLKRIRNSGDELAKNGLENFSP